jgi:pyruvate formate lyase activating enzyme
MFYEKLKENEIRCKLCPKECEIGDRERGWCGVRENREGTYYTMVYGNPCSAYPDPIEKKPFFHFLPGTWAFSIATAGCNLNCKFCQNWEISQVRPEETRNFRLPPADVVAAAKESNCKSIAYTYTEPTVFYEYMLDTAKLGRKSSLKSVVISAGYINPEPMKVLCESVDAVKIDLKSLRNKYYNEICSGELQPVLNVLKVLRDSGVWYEIVYLVVPSLNDSDEELKDTARWIYENLGPDVPLHFSRFYPMYQLKNLPPTDPKRLTWAREMAMDIGLNYVYVGNVSGDPGESTHCPKCGKVLVKRVRYFIRQNDIVDGKCKWCSEKIPGVWHDDQV